MYSLKLFDLLHLHISTSFTKQLQDMFSNLTDKTTERVHNKIVCVVMKLEN